MSADLPDLYELWDYSDPAGTREKFEKILPRAESSDDISYYLQLLTQIARTHGLQADFDSAHKILDKVESALSDEFSIEKIRYLLERGRSFNSDKQKDKALPLFIESYELSKNAGEAFYAVDAAHMVAIAATDPAEKEKWNLIGVADAEASDQPRTRKWLGSLYNNLGWDFFDQNRFADALTMFEKTLEFFLSDQPDEFRANIANWSIAKAYRLLGRLDEALAIQTQLCEKYDSTNQSDGYVFEELAEIHLAKGDTASAEPFFAKAFEKLNQDTWLQREEADRLARLQELGNPLPS